MKTVAELMDGLRRFRLLDEGQLKQLASRYAGQNPDPKIIAKFLVEQAWLTPYQANQLFKGKGADLLLGSYVLMETVGEGGMGTVFKARNWKMNTLVAVKRIKPERLANQSSVKRFEREIRASAKLQHPNIVRAIDADEVAGNHLLVTEYVDGAMDLHRLVKERGPVSLEDACRFMMQAALGLQHAFEQGMVHRDIKPHNLLVGGLKAAAKQPVPAGAAGAAGAGAAGSDPGQRAQTVVKILDFGLARLEKDEDSSTLTQEGSVMGTVDYLAPEQARDSHNADIRADIYSLGCTLYYLLTGQAPFLGGTAAEKMYKHQFEDPTPVQLVRRDAPQALDSVIRKAMAKRPEHRYQTPVDLACDLDAVLKGRPVSITLPPPASAAPLPVAVPISAPASSQAEQDTENPFAALQTAADGPVSLARSKEILAAPNAPKNLGMLLGIGGGAVALMMIVIVLVVVLRRPKGPEVVDGPHVNAPKNTNPKKTKAEEDAAEEKRRMAEEDKAAKEKKRQDDEAADLEKKNLLAQEEIWKKWSAAEEPIRAKRAADAALAFNALEAKHQEKGTTFLSFAKDLAAFQVSHGGTPSAMRGAELLATLHSPLDDLNPAQLSADAKSGWHMPELGDGLPKELVAVRGEQRGRHWAAVTQVAFTGTQDKVLLSVSGTNLALMAADSRDIHVVIPGADVWTISPDNKQLAIGSFDGPLQVYDIDTAKQVWSTELFIGGGVRSLAFAPDGKTLAAGGGPNRLGTGNAGFLVRLFDAASGKSRGVSPGLPNMVNGLHFSNDGNTLSASISGNPIYLMDPQRPQDAAIVSQEGGVYTDTFSPDSKLLAVQIVNAQKTTVKIYDVATRKLTATLADINADQNYQGMFSPDSTRYAYREYTGNIRMWEMPKGDALKPVEVHREGGVAALAFTKDGKELWASSGWASGMISIVDPKTGKQIKSMPGYDEPQRGVYDLKISNDDALVGWLCNNREVRIWNRAKQAIQCVITRAEPGPFAFSADGKRIVTGDSNMIRVWDSSTGLEINPLRGRAPIQPSIAFAPAGRFLLASVADGKGTIQRWPFAPAAENDLMQWQCPSGAFTETPRVAVLPDGRRFMTYGTTVHLYRWNLAAEVGLTLSPSPAAACISPSGRLGVTSTLDGAATVWNLDSTKEVIALSTKMRPELGDMRLVDIAITADERLAVIVQGSNRPRMLRIFSMETGKEVFRHFKPHDCSRVAISPDGRYFFTTDYDGCTLWDLHNGTPIRKISFGQPELPVAFSPDGKHVAAITASGVAILEMPSANRVKELPFPGPVHALAFAPDSRHLAVSNGNGSIYVLRLAEASAKAGAAQ